MNRRERILAMTALAVVIVVGGGVLFKYLFWDSLSAVNTQIAAAQDDLDKKQAELTKERLDRQAILRRDPRLTHWQHISLPEDKNQEKELKSGWPIEEVKKRHEDKVQTDYEQYLHDLVLRSGFAPNSIKVSSAVADRKGGPILAGKTPAYTRLSVTVQGQSTLDGVVKMLQEFYATPLLHEVRNLTLTSKPPQNRTGPATGAPAAGAPGSGPPGFGAGGPPGFGAGGPPGFGAGGPGGRRGGFGGGAQGGDLDVNMTVEALLVTGADKRDSLLPESTDVKAQVLPQPERHYTDMLIKNMFTGIPAESKLTEDRAQVLAVVKLTGVWSSGRRWEATYYDQGKGGDEKRITERTVNEFSVADKYNNVLVEGKVVKIDQSGVVFQADNKYYRWRLGDFLGPVLESPLKEDDLKELGVAAN